MSEREAIDLAAKIAFARQQKNRAAREQRYEEAGKHREEELRLLDELKKLDNGEQP